MLMLQLDETGLTGLIGLQSLISNQQRKIEEFMNLTIIGTGFVGVVTAAVYASFDNQVVGLDIDQEKIESLKNGQVPFYEPGLKDLLVKQQQAGNLTFTTDYKQAISGADVIMIAVGTPSKENDEVDLSYVFAACKTLAPYLKEDAIVAVKSTVPPKTLDKVKKIIDSHTDTNYYTASVPEFLKEGSAVEDTLHPDRVVLGANDQRVFKVLQKLHQPLNAPILKMSPESAQMTKYTANAYLATRITFINQIANLCEQNQADIKEVIAGIGFDERIGKHYWYPGFGYGGSCFPKDVKELAAYARSIGQDSNLMITINQLNNQRIPRLLISYGEKINGWEEKQVAVLGLSFKPHTDDTREAPAVKAIPWLLNKGAKIKSFDPMAKWQPENNQESYQQKDSIKEACQDADVIFILIEWPEIINYDFESVRTDKKQTFIDARNQFDPDEIRQVGFNYIGVGRNGA